MPAQRAIVERMRDYELEMTNFAPKAVKWHRDRADALTALLEATASPAPAPLDCVCQVPDGLVQEWVSKARAVAASKGFNTQWRGQYL